MALLEVFLIVVSSALCIFVYFKWAFGYWKRKGVPYQEPTIPMGNMDNIFKRNQSAGHRFKAAYVHFKAQGAKFAGTYMFASPILVPVDTELIKNIMVRDFLHFTDRGFYSNEKDDPLSANLFVIGGPKWRNYRTKLSPTFSSGKIKMMFQTVIECSKQMTAAIDERCRDELDLNVKDMMASFTTDVISSCAFGLESNSCQNPDEEFRRQGRRFMYFTRRNGFRNVVSYLKPDICRSLGIKLINEQVSDYFLNTVKNTVEFREKNDFIRKDFMQLIIDLKNRNGLNSDDEQMNELAAHAFAFYVGGFETSSTTMAFAMFEMAMNPDVQKKAREEVKAVLDKYGGEFTYDAVLDMKYLQQVMDETMRKYPILSLITRTCVKDYKIPDTDVVIEKNTKVIIPLLGLHHDPEFWPNPDVFDPERFSDENRENIRPYTYMPFGEGPRICIGLRFGKMQSKIGLAAMLNKYEFCLSDDMKLPLSYEVFGFTLDSATELKIKLKKIVQ